MEICGRLLDPVGGLTFFWHRVGIPTHNHEFFWVNPHYRLGFSGVGILSPSFSGKIFACCRKVGNVQRRNYAKKTIGKHRTFLYLRGICKIFSKNMDFKSTENILLSYDQLSHRNRERENNLEIGLKIDMGKREQEITFGHTQSEKKTEIK